MLNIDYHYPKFGMIGLSMEFYFIGVELDFIWLVCCFE